MTGGPHTLRRAGSADVKAIRDLTRAAYSRWVPVIGREPKPMTADYQKAVENHLIDVVEDEAGLVALIETIVEPDHLLIENIAVREGRQGHGLGSLLLAHVEELARQSAMPEVRLYTNAAFASNLAFYRARGFAETGREPLADGGTVVHFAKRMSESA